MPDTLASLTASVQRWLRGENVDDLDVYDAVNDAIESLWKSITLAALQVSLGGPVSIQFNSGDERETIIAIPDPALNLAIAGVAGGALAQHTVYGAYTLVTESGSETNPSPTQNAVIALNKLAQFGPVAFVSGAIGWNLYAGAAANQLCKQNDEPLAFGSVWTEPVEGIASAPDLPLPPTSNSTGDNVFMLRHLEFKTQAGVYKPYDAADIDSALMRQMAATVATPSDWQPYAWDLVNQTTLEIRPAAGQTFSPRYFYIVKPRRLRFPNSPLPFPTVPSTAFLRMYALSEIFLTLHEYDAAGAWETKADKERMECIRAVTQMNTNRNDRVTPYMYGGGQSV